jgi:hypothetical protein
MPTPSQLIEPAFKYFVIAEATAKYFALIALVLGAIGWFTAGSNMGRAFRFRGIFVGGAVALLAIFGLAALYDTILWIMGPSFLPIGWPYAAIGVTGIAPFAQALSGVLHYLGLAAFSMGATFWAMATPRSRMWQRGYRGVTLGLAMIAVSVGGQLFSVFTVVL